MSQRIGFAGLGLMGSRMARNLVKKGFETTVWNRTPARTAPLAAEGARVAATPRELAERSDVVVACVADPPAVERLVFAEDGLIHAVRKGFRYLECSTVSPETTKRVQAALREKGADALEAPVTGSKNGADQGTLLFMTGGPRAVHEELMPVMMAMGTKAIYCGEMGQGSTMKLIGNHFISLMLEALCEGVVVGRKHGLPLETILEVVQASGFASPYFAFKGAAIGKRDWSEHFAIDLLVKDQTLMLETAARRARADAGPRRRAGGVPVGARPGLRPRGHLRRRQDARARGGRAFVTKAVAILVAAGRGERMGAERPKAFLELGGRAAPAARGAAFEAAPSVEPGRRGPGRGNGRGARAARSARQAPRRGGGRRAAPGLGAGGTRPAARGFEGVVLIHDAARPLVESRSSRPWPRGRWRRGRRCRCCRSSTPSSASAAARSSRRSTAASWAGRRRRRASASRSCARRSRPRSRRGSRLTDEAMAVERLGRAVDAVPGSKRNRKLTTPDDLAWAEGVVAGILRT